MVSWCHREPVATPVHVSLVADPEHNTSSPPQLDTPRHSGRRGSIDAARDVLREAALALSGGASSGSAGTKSPKLELGGGSTKSPKSSKKFRRPSIDMTSLFMPGRRSRRSSEDQGPVLTIKSATADEEGPPIVSLWIVGPPRNILAVLVPHSFSHNIVFGGLHTSLSLSPSLEYSDFYLKEAAKEALERFGHKGCTGIKENPKLTSPRLFSNSVYPSVAEDKLSSLFACFQVPLDEIFNPNDTIVGLNVPRHRARATTIGNGHAARCEQESSSI